MVDDDNTFERTIYHRDYNEDKKDNINTFPTDPAVFGIFAIMHDKPMNCRYIGETDNLRLGVKELFEKAGEVSPGLAQFMQGEWIKMLVYEPMPGVSREDRQKKVEEWIKKYNPKCNDKGEYRK